MLCLVRFFKTITSSLVPIFHIFFFLVAITKYIERIEERFYFESKGGTSGFSTGGKIQQQEGEAGGLMVSTMRL